MGNQTTITLAPGMKPVAPILRLLGDLDREKLEAFIEISVALLDAYDGDPDLEANGDEQDGVYCEDEFADMNGMNHPDGYRGPGCPISDPGGCEHDGREHETGF
ncbi:hypothetical protein [Parasphingorhabdus sp.]|uniref:hypothetical protein n=1 Tax=Parasphingorhabdus sp. TaxID=2709688 RepID=UPI003001C574